MTLISESDMWANIKRAYSETDIIQRAFLWFALGVAVVTAFIFPFLVVIVVASVIAFATVISVVDFLFKIFQ